MSWPFPRSARPLLALGLCLLGLTALVAPPPVLGQADTGEEPAQEQQEKPRRMVQEVIIDDSGIVIREGDNEVQVELGADGEVPSAVIRTGHRSYSTEISEGEQVSFGEDVVVDSDEVINNNMVILFGDLRVYGKIVGDVVVIMGDVNLYDGSEVTGDILCVGGEVNAEPGAEVFGEITPVQTNFRGMWDSGWDFDEFHFGRRHYGFGDSVLKLIQFLVFAGIGLLLLNRRLPTMTAALRHRAGRSLLLGLLGIVLAILLLVPAILVLILLVLTIVGIPVAILAILAIAGLAYLCLLLPLYTLSRYTFEARGMNRYLSVGIWTLIAWFLYSLGETAGGFWLSTVVEVIVLLLGIGVLVLTRLGTRAPDTA